MIYKSLNNPINEAAHKSLEALLPSRKQYDVVTPYVEMLLDSIFAYNSTLHSSTGYFPYFILFGRDMTLPGLQRFTEVVTEDVRKSRITDVRIQAMKRAVMSADQNLNLYVLKDLKVGDTVVYYLQEYEKKSIGEELESTSLKYTPSSFF